jgi:ankyrin repeat protein
MPLRRFLLAFVLLCAWVPTACLADANDDLMAAVFGGDLAKAQVAISAGANPNHVVDGRTATIFVVAMLKPKLEVVRLLLDSGANPNVALQRGPTTITPLHMAVKANDLAVLRALVEYDADLSVGDNLGTTPLVLAASDRRPALVAYLLSVGDDPNRRDGEGRTALHWAARFGDAEVVAMLLAHGADAELRTGAGMTALDLAQEHGHAPVAAQLEAKPKP